MSSPICAGYPETLLVAPCPTFAPGPEHLKRAAASEHKVMIIGGCHWNHNGYLFIAGIVQGLKDKFSAESLFDMFKLLCVV